MENRLTAKFWLLFSAIYFLQGRNEFLQGRNGQTVQGCEVKASGCLKNSLAGKSPKKLCAMEVCA